MALRVRKRHSRPLRHSSNVSPLGDPPAFSPMVPQAQERPTPCRVVLLKMVPLMFPDWRIMHCDDLLRAQEVVQSASQCLRSIVSNSATCLVVVAPTLTGEHLLMFSVQSETRKAAWYWTAPGVRSTPLLRQRTFLCAVMGHELLVAHIATSGRRGPTLFFLPIDWRMTPRTLRPIVGANLSWLILLAARTCSVAVLMRTANCLQRPRPSTGA
mmetsp:Transcript_85332/g.164304  ORF Transcript_85332/g.164304 Transcript_85332/m.164304 type:complete len:213 (+) Transcript_85332:212-850(+)